MRNFSKLPYFMMAMFFVVFTMFSSVSPIGIVTVDARDVGVDDPLVSVFDSVFACYENGSGLPEVVTGQTQSGATVSAAVIWNTSGLSFTPYSTISVPGLAFYGGGIVDFTAKVEVVKPGIRYFVNIGTNGTYYSWNSNTKNVTVNCGSDVFDAVGELVGTQLINSISDRESTDASNWGWFKGSSNANVSPNATNNGSALYGTDKYDTMVAYQSSTGAFSYRFTDLPPGTYNIAFGISGKKWSQQAGMRLLATPSVGSAVNPSALVASANANVYQEAQVTLEGTENGTITAQFTASVNSGRISWIEVSDANAPLPVLPDSLTVGTPPIIAAYETDSSDVLPNKITVDATIAGVVIPNVEADVVWNSVSFVGKAYETVSVVGTATYSGVSTPVMASVEVVKPDTVYFINAGTETVSSDVWEAVKVKLGSSLINSAASDQLYSSVSGWGYEGDSYEYAAVKSADKYNSVRYGENNRNSSFSYKMTVNEIGKYALSIGFKSPWPTTARNIRVIAEWDNGAEVNVIADSLLLSSSNPLATIKDFILNVREPGEITLIFSPESTDQATVVSWIQLVQTGESTDPPDFGDVSSANPYYADTYFTVYDIEAGGTLTASTRFTNLTNNIYVGSSILGVYDNEGRLIDVSIRDFTAAPNAVSELTFDFDLPEELPEDVEVKNFIFDDALMPADNAVVFKAADRTMLPTPMVWYDFNQTDGTDIEDKSGNGNNGVLNGSSGGTATWGEGVLTLANGSTTTSAGTGRYISAPVGLLNGKDSITISLYTKQDITNSASDYFTFAVQQNPASQSENYLLLNTVGRHKFMITTNHWTGEQGLNSTTSNMGLWEHYVLVVTPTALSMYINGNLVGSQAVTTKLTDLGSNLNVDLGRSSYSGDRLFSGSYGDFRIYDGVLSKGEIELLTAEVLDYPIEDNKKLPEKLVDDWNNLSLSMPSGAFLTKSIATPPTTAPNGSAIVWKSTNPSVLTTLGRVNRPQEGMPNVDVALIAQVIAPTGEKLTKIFNYTVIAKGDEGVLYAELNEIELEGNYSDFAYDAILQKVSKYGCDITWSSSNTNVMEHNGLNKVTDDSKHTVTMTVTVSKGNNSKSKDFILNVVKPRMYGYLFAYFTGEGSGEQIRFGLSRDGYQWREMANRVVVTPTSGSTHVRDPFIIKGPAPDGTIKYYMIGTDLWVNAGSAVNGGATSGGYGNCALYTWESSDLINWSKETRLVLAGTTANTGNIYAYTQTSGVAWAPEAVWDPNYEGDGFTGAYMMYWTANIRNSTGASNHIVYAYTRDFKTLLTEPAYLYSNANPLTTSTSEQTMDASIIRVNDIFYMFYRETTSTTGIFRVEATNITGNRSDWSNRTQILGNGDWEGPEAFPIIGSNSWMLIADKFGGNGTTNGNSSSRFGAFLATDITGTRAHSSNNAGTGNFAEVPAGTGSGQTNINSFMSSGRARHGAVVQIDETRFKALWKEYLGAEYTEN